MTTPISDTFVAAPCLREFDDHEHNDANPQSECERMLDVMDGGYYSDYDYTSYDYPEYDAQTAHFERWGRPAFPNEY